MAVWACKNELCNYCPHNPKSCSEFKQAKLRVVSQACIDYRNEPNYTDLIRLQNEIFPVMLDVKVNNEETKLDHKHTEVLTSIQETVKIIATDLFILQKKFEKLEQKKVNSVDTQNYTKYQGSNNSIS